MDSINTRKSGVYPAIKECQLRLDSDFPNPTVLLPKLTPPIPFKNKTGLVMAAFSNCERVRTEYMRQLMKFVQVDSYGRCLHNRNGLTKRYRNRNGKDFRDIKSELVRQYKFTLVFFNQDCDYIWNGSGKDMMTSLELLLETTGCQSIQFIAKSVLRLQKDEYTRMV